ncbi:MAG: hypothetical protein JWN15_3334 [Firmicutes bacterium]|nr:hypothetical protein [Bacillota bacterium]
MRTLSKSVGWVLRASIAVHLRSCPVRSAGGDRLGPVLNDSERS